MFFFPFCFSFSLSHSLFLFFFFFFLYKYVHADEINVTRDRPKGVERRTLERGISAGIVAISVWACATILLPQSNYTLPPGLNSNPQNGSRFQFSKLKKKFTHIRKLCRISVINYYYSRVTVFLF